jgi:selenocysteine-specific elongation factor
VLDIAPPHRRRRDAGLKRDLEGLAEDDPAQSLAIRIRRAGLEGATTQALTKQTGLSKNNLDETLDQLAASQLIVRIDSSMSLSDQAATRLKSDLLTTLAQFHAREPLLPGMPRASLANSLPENVSRGAGVFLLTELANQGELRIQDELVCAANFESGLDPSQDELAERLRNRFRQAALDVPSLRTLAEELDESPGALREICHFLERQGRLVSAPDELFFDRDSVVALIEKVLRHFDQQAELDTQTLKAFIGTSRRTAMPLMALLDDLQITRRDGSLRRLLNRTPRW